jgi:hypothetical protein
VVVVDPGAGVAGEYLTHFGGTKGLLLGELEQLGGQRRSVGKAGRDVAEIVEEWVPACLKQT